MATGVGSTTSTIFIARSILRTRRPPLAACQRRLPKPTMIEAHHFVEAARARGFRWYAGVPCSYLTPFINYVLQDRSLRYLSMANEGDAVALIAGATLGGAHRGVTMMQNSGLGNAVSPLTSLTW